jgi:putative N6-adenine-specific DNA methylase
MNESLYIATTLFGLEEILSRELIDLGAEDIVIMNRAIGFSASQAVLYKINLGSRTAMRILKNIRTFTAFNADDLYKNIYNIGWKDIFSVKDSFMVNSAVNSPRFTHSHFVSQKSKDAIVDHFRKINGIRPPVNTENPDIVINIHISNDKVNVALDSSGEPLFKRGYRAAQYVAPLNEILAAGMLMIAGWTGESNFVDFMCGSGTLPIEAALIAKKIPPGIFRDKFGFMRWKDFDETLYVRIKENLFKPIDFRGTISASDISGEAISLTKRNLHKTFLEDVVKVKKEDFRSFSPPEGGGLLIFNPPYGERLKENEIEDFYREIGDTLKKKYKGYEAWILSANLAALKFIGLHPEKKYDLINGSLKCKFQKYLIYEGSLKTGKQNKI